MRSDYKSLFKPNKELLSLTIEMIKCLEMPSGRVHEDIAIAIGYAQKDAMERLYADKKNQKLGSISYLSTIDNALSLIHILTEEKIESKSFDNLSYVYMQQAMRNLAKKHELHHTWFRKNFNFEVAREITLLVLENYLKILEE